MQEEKESFSVFFNLTRQTFSTAGILQQVQINAQELNLCSWGYGAYTEE